MMIRVCGLPVRHMVLEDVKEDWKERVDLERNWEKLGKNCTTYKILQCKEAGVNEEKLGGRR